MCCFISYYVIVPYLSDESVDSITSFVDSGWRRIRSLMLSNRRRWNVLYSRSTDDVSPKLKSATSTENLRRETIENALILSHRIWEDIYAMLKGID